VDLWVVFAFSRVRKPCTTGCNPVQLDLLLVDAWSPRHVKGPRTVRFYPSPTFFELKHVLPIPIVKKLFPTKYSL